MSDPDLFPNLFEPSPYLILSVIFSFLGLVILVLSLYGIVWYERFGSDNKRTLINKLVSAQCWSTICYYCFCQMLDILRFITAAYPERACFFLVVIKNSIKAQILLFIDANLLSQYVFIFWLKNPAGVNDDFWSCFITLWIKGFSYIFYLVKLTLDAKMPIVYYTCANIIPQNFSSLPNSFQGHFEIFSILFYILVKIKIEHFKRSSPAAENESETHLSRKRQVIESMAKNSLTNSKTNLMILSVYFSFIFVSVRLNQSSLEAINEFPNNIAVYFFQLISPILIGLSIVIIIYSRNSTMREFLIGEVKANIRQRVQ